MAVARTCQGFVVGPEHPDVAAALHDLGKVYLDENRLPKAKRLFGQALALYSRTYRLHPALYETLTDYADLLRRTKRFELADKLEARAQRVRPKLPDSGESK